MFPNTDLRAKGAQTSLKREQYVAPKAEKLILKGERTAVSVGERSDKARSGIRSSWSGTVGTKSPSSAVSRKKEL